MVVLFIVIGLIVPIISDIAKSVDDANKTREKIKRDGGSYCDPNNPYLWCRSVP